MITNALINFFYAICNFMIGLLPVGGAFPAPFHSSAVLLSHYMYVLDDILPVDTLLFCLKFTIANAILVWAIRTGFMIFIGSVVRNTIKRVI